MRVFRDRNGAALVATAFGLAVLAGCSTLGGNVRGNFQCTAPGGMCAPTSAIDDQALALIEDGGSAPTSGSPSGEGDARFIRVKGNEATRAPAQRGLRIMLPARVDRFGRWREPQIVYADVSMAELPSTLGGAERLSLTELAAGAPEAVSVPSPARQAAAAAPGDFNDRVRRAYAAGLGSGGDVAPAGAVAAAPAGVVPTAAVKPVPAPQAGVQAPAAKVAAPAFPGAVEGDQ